MSSIPFIGIIDTLKGDVFLVLEETIEFWPESVESEFGKDELDVGSN